MANQQIGNGNAADTQTIPGPLSVAGRALFNGVTTTPTITTLPVTATTADIAAIGTAVNSILTALDNLGLVNQ